MAQTAFRIEVAGFNNTLPTLADVATYVANLKREFPWVIGKTATVWQGEDHGSFVCFPANCPTKTLTVSA